MLKVLDSDVPQMMLRIEKEVADEVLAEVAVELSALTSVREYTADELPFKVIVRLALYEATLTLPEYLNTKSV